jgi:DNA-binding NarL/FixJ family response regulator
MTIRVLIVDDQALVRAGFRKILEPQKGIEVVGEASDGQEGVRAAQQLQPDVTLMDIRMPVLDGIAATRLLAGPGVPRPLKVVILTTYDVDEYVYDALSAGASGFLLKDVPPEDLVQGVRIVAAGDALLAPTVTRRLIAEFAHRSRPSRPQLRSVGVLTARELEVLELVARGLSNSEIAASLYVSENTVKTHVAHLLDKLGLRDRVHVVVYAYEVGVVEPGVKG